MASQTILPQIITFGGAADQRPHVGIGRDVSGFLIDHPRHLRAQPGLTRGATAHSYCLLQPTHMVARSQDNMVTASFLQPREMMVL